MSQPNKRKALLVSLLACPVLLLIFIPVLSPFSSLYGTAYEKVILSVIAVLPFVGIFGIIQFSGSSLWAKAAWSLAYFTAMLVPVAGSAIFIGCSWAGACF